ncbi:MAG: GNAT family N-acetyltransferase [Ginsengibacter sp.]
MAKNYVDKCPVLQTERFLLRPLSINDDNEIFLIRSDERVLQYTAMAKALTIDDAREFIKKIDVGIAEGESFYWAIVYNGKEKLAGTICLWNFDEEKTVAEIGYALLPEYFGKEIMQEIIPAIISYGFKQLGLQTILGDVHPGNVKSVQLLKKFGFIPDDQNKDTHDADVVLYTLSVANWSSSRQ